MATFTAEVFQNEYLPEGSTEVHAVVSVTCADAGAAGRTGQGEAAEVILLDTSGSMDMPSAKIVAARKAAQVALDEIADGTLFAMVAGNTGTQMLYPDQPSLARMDAASRAEAQRRVGQVRTSGATTIGAWINSMRELFQGASASQSHAILLTDGKQEGEPPADLDRALEAATGVFQCDCRGVGDNWKVEQLRRISTALLGSVDIIAEPDDMEADFEQIMRDSMGRGVAGAQLRLWAPEGSEILFVRQVAPTLEDLTDRATQVTNLIREYPTGAWGDEARDYHVAVRVPPAPVGSERLAARVEVVVADEVQSKALVRAIWSGDDDLTTRINPAVAHYTGQAELAEAIQEGLAARQNGDDDAATRLLGRAAELAHDSGNESTTRLLGKVVVIDDPETGTVRLRSDVVKVDEMALDTRSTKTIRIAKQAARSDDPAPPPDTGPHGPGRGPTKADGTDTVGTNTEEAP